MTCWRKSSHSTFQSNCVEAAGEWKKSSASNFNGNCAEVASLTAGTVAIRDTQDRSGPVLTFGAKAWGEFTARTKVPG